MKPSQRNRFIVIVSSCYALFALAWIFLSDQLLLKFHDDIESMLWFSTAKGVGFVVITAFLLIFALRAVPPTVATPGQESLLDLFESRLARQKKHSLLTYVITIMITLATLLVCEHLAMPLENRPLLNLVMFPIILSVYFGGLWPGLLSTAIALCWLFLSLIPPFERFNQVSYIDLFQEQLWFTFTTKKWEAYHEKSVSSAVLFFVCSAASLWGKASRNACSNPSAGDG